MMTTTVKVRPAIVKELGLRARHLRHRSVGLRFKGTPEEVSPPGDDEDRQRGRPPRGSG